VLVTADVSQSITCQVTGTNGSGSASATSNTITPIAAVDPDAQAFITAAAITDPTQQAAINTLVVDLKAAFIWSKMLTIYPFVGGTASAHSYNLKNTAVGQLTYSTGVTHSSLGINGNGTAYCNTGLKASTIGISQNSAAAGVYVGTAASQAQFQYGTFGNFHLYKYVLTTYSPSVNNGLGDANYIATTNVGFAQSSRNNSTQILFKDKGLTASTLTATSTALNSTFDIWILNANNYGGGTTNKVSFFYISTGLTATELTSMYTAVQKFQTTLGRQV
jgi:hypothetical protein